MDTSDGMRALNPLDIRQNRHSTADKILERQLSAILRAAARAHHAGVDQIVGFRPFRSPPASTINVSSCGTRCACPLWARPRQKLRVLRTKTEQAEVRCRRSAP